MKLYKVVSLYNGERYSATKAISKKHGLTKTVLKYPKGAIVKAPLGSFGIFCFKTRHAAVSFIHESWFYNLNVEAEIIQVQSIGQRRRLTIIPLLVDYNDMLLYKKQKKFNADKLRIKLNALNRKSLSDTVILFKHKNDYYEIKYREIPHDTVVYSAVKVLT